MATRIIGTGRGLPEKVVTNDDLSKFMETSDEWIASRTGIRERRLATTETTAGMAAEASKKALAMAGMNPEELDLITVGTITNDYVTPSCACEVQSMIGATNAMAFDVNAACTGFMVALNTAHVYMLSGKYKNALVIGAETLSKIMDWNDRSTCVLFGDGAGAAVLSFDKNENGSRGLISYTQGADGASGMQLAGQNRTNNNPFVSTSKELKYVSMDGQEVYKFAVSKVPASILQVLEEADMKVEDISYFILHQANIRIIQSVAKRLKVDVDKFPISLDHCGNVSAASVPILLDEVNEKGLLKKGDKIVVAGFGGGLTWSAGIIEW